MGAGMFGSWLLRHGIMRGLTALAAKAGDPHARLSYYPTVRDDPYPTYKQLRDKAGITRGALTVVVTTHEGASRVLASNDFEVGFDVRGVVPWILRKTLTRPTGTLVGPIDPPSLLAVNPPVHTKYRRQVAKVFTARNIAKLDDHIRKATDALLDELDGHDHVDLVPTFAGLLPVTVISQILGIPTSMREQFLTWGNSAAMSLDIALRYDEFVECENGVRALNEWMYGHIARLRANPGEDLLSGLIHAEDEGKKMDDREIMATVSLLLAAGFETTVNALSAGAHLLSTHPEQRALLAADPARWGNAVEEILRFEAPVQETMRCAAAEVVIDGFRIRKGEFLGVQMGAANRDPAVFADPDRFDILRANARDHLTFSSGVHHCIGAALARAEVRIGLQRLLERFPDLALDGVPTYRGTRTLRGFRTLPMRLRLDEDVRSMAS